MAASTSERTASGASVTLNTGENSETPPVRPAEPGKLFATRRKKDAIKFDFEDSGKTAYFAVRIVNGAMTGGRGKTVQALIP
ncbi:MAG: hypothetical protein LBJ86_04780 [Spirochaetaceae bacterium]|nr:hypothetical protein [Spirochaetaceae bacterium]